MNDTPENFCTSSIQCIFFMIDWGFRSSGGIGDILSKMSYKANPGHFFGKLFYNLIFYILVLMVMGNLFLAVIVEAVRVLREKNVNNLKDAKDVCFVCKLTREDASRQKINFEKHTKFDHNLWHYLYFVTHIKLGDSKKFGPYEKYVERLLEGNKRSSWFPVVVEKIREPTKTTQMENPAWSETFKKQKSKNVLNLKEEIKYDNLMTEKPNYASKNVFSTNQLNNVFKGDVEFVTPIYNNHNSEISKFQGMTYN